MIDKTSPREEIDATDYHGADLPYDDKPHKPDRPYSSWWEYVVSLIESVSWEPLYATTSIIGYILTITPKENALHEFSHSWIPLVVTIVVGRLVITRWNSEQPLFNQLEEQDESRLSRLAIIMVPGEGNTGTGRDRGDQGASSPEQTLNLSKKTDFSIASILSQNGNSGGNEPPPQLAHNYTKNCPACNYAACTELVKLLDRQSAINYFRWKAFFHAPNPLQQAFTGTYYSGHQVGIINPDCKKTNSTSNPEVSAFSRPNVESPEKKHPCTHSGCGKEFVYLGRLICHQYKAHPPEGQPPHVLDMR